MQIKAINTHKVVLSADSLIKQHKLMQKCEVLAAFFLPYDNAMFLFHFALF